MNKGVGVLRDKKMKLEDLNVSDTQGGSGFHYFFAFITRE